MVYHDIIYIYAHIYIFIHLSFHPFIYSFIYSFICIHSIYIYIHIYIYVCCDFRYNYALMWCTHLLSACGDWTICLAGYLYGSGDSRRVGLWIIGRRTAMESWVPKGAAACLGGAGHPPFHLPGRAISFWIHLQLTGSAYSVLVNSSATSCVIHTGSGASSSSYLSLAVRVDDPGRSAILSVLTLALCLQLLVPMVDFHLCRTMSRHRAQFNYLGVRFQNLFLVWRMSKSTRRSSSS